MWQQRWVVPAATESEAIERVGAVLERWTPMSAPPAHVGAVRILTGPDETGFADQFLEEMAEVREIAANTPRETLARRIAYLRHRGLGIPPRAGWVVVTSDGPRSPRPPDWTRGGGARWVVEVEWPGDPPEVASDTGQ